MPDTPLAKLLIVDDETPQMKALCHTLDFEGYCATGFASANEALATLQHEAFDLVLTDLMMPEMDGIALLRAAFETDPNLVGIVMTGHGAVDTAVQALKAGALDYILKPFRLSAILPVLTRALGVRRLRMENIQLREAVGIYELGMAIAFAHDFEAILQMVADAAFQQTQARGLSIFLPVHGGEELRVAVARGENAESLVGSRAPLSDAVSDWVARCRELLSRPDEFTEVKSAFSSPSQEIGDGISIPMLAGGKLIGILNFTQKHPHRPVTLGQVKALNILASTGASALAREVAENRAALMEEVEQKNRELETFTYSVSHDLRAPLRSISGFSRILLEDHAPNLDAKGQECLKRMCASAQRMGELIDDLLKLSRLGRAELHRRPVNLGDLARTVAAELQRANANRHVQVVAPEEVMADADSRLLQIVFENLFGNAWKFTANRPDATVEFGVTRRDNGPAYFIRDNGAGFDMQFVQRLFTPFQRLHKETEFPGTGIGLATVHRIVERHGGRVWAEGAVNGGASFFWTLPEPRFPIPA